MPHRRFTKTRDRTVPPLWHRRDAGLQAERRSFEEELALFERQARDEAGLRTTLRGHPAPAAWAAQPAPTRNF